MKTLANTLLIMAAIIMVAGAFFKIMHYPGSAMIIMTANLAGAAGLILAFIAGKKTKTS
jgi:hypothetical protein